VADYRIDDLARSAGTTVRNVRVYQDRGLLPPPRREGRTGVYSEAHLARLRLIGSLLEKGYTFAHIGEFLQAWQRGRNLTDLLGLEAVLTNPWSDEVDDWASWEQIVALFGEDQLTEENLTVALAQELVVPEGDRFRIPSPRLLHAGSELVKAGIPLSVVLGLSAQLAKDMAASAERLVGAVADHVVLPLTASYDTSLAEVSAIIDHLKPLAQLAVDAHLARAMERTVRTLVQQHMESTAAEDPAAAS
jgi:DNA-binding transcriptional MerR regulator